MINVRMKMVSSLEKCFIDDTVESKREKTGFIMFANENLAFQVMYHGDMDDEGIATYVGDLEVSGALAPYATVRAVANVLNMYPTYNVPFEGELLRTEPGAYPDLIRPLPYPNCVSLPNGQTLALWVDIELPEGFAAGVYDFTLSVSLRGEVIGEASCSVTVQHCWLKASSAGPLNPVRLQLQQRL